MADVPVQFPDKEIGLGEALLEEAEALDDARPAPALVGDFEHVDLEDVAGFGAVDEDGTGEGVNAGAVDGKIFGEVHLGMDLRAARVEALHMNRVAGIDAQARREGAVPDGMRGIGGKGVLLHLVHGAPESEWSTSTVICSSTRALRGRADTPMAARTWRPAFAEKFDEKIGGAVDDLGRIRKAGDGVDVAVDGDDGFDCVERAEVLAQHSQLRECAGARGVVSFFNGSIRTRGACDDARGVRGDYAREENQRADRAGGQIIAARGRQGRQGDAEFLEARFGSGWHEASVESPGR